MKSLLLVGLMNLFVHLIWAWVAFSVGMTFISFLWATYAPPSYNVKCPF